MGFDPQKPAWRGVDRKSTRLNSSHQIISYAVFCLKKKKNSFDKHFQHLKIRNNSRGHSPSCNSTAPTPDHDHLGREHGERTHVPYPGPSSEFSLQNSY